MRTCSPCSQLDSWKPRGLELLGYQPDSCSSKRVVDNLGGEQRLYSLSLSASGTISKAAKRSGEDIFLYIS